MVDTVRLDELFEIGKGVAPSRFASVEDEPFVGSVALLRPASSQMNTLVGWVDPGEHSYYESGVIHFSANGDGSHTFTYVSIFDFIPTNNALALIPKINMSLNEKLFYAMSITANRPRFSYGRIPQGERLASLQLPATPPDWVHDYRVDTILGEFDKAMVERKSDVAVGHNIDTSDWVDFRIGDLFEIKRGNVKGIKGLASGDVPVVSARETDNGVAERADVVPQFDAGTVSVSVNGAVGFATVQQESWSGTGDVMALLLKDEAADPSTLAKLAVCTLIREEGQRFGYARKLNQERLENMAVRLPALLDENHEAVVDWGRLDAKMQELAFSQYVLTGEL